MAKISTQSHANGHTAFRIFAMDPGRRVWTIRTEEDTVDAACRQAAAIRDSGLRVRVVPFYMRELTIKLPVHNDTRAWREQQADQMSDLADANKRYKSPG